MGHPEWDLAPQAAFRITRRVRGLQNSPHRIHFRSRLDGKFDLEPHCLSPGCALQDGSRPSEVRDDFRPPILQRNFQVSRAAVVSPRLVRRTTASFRMPSMVRASASHAIW